MLLNINHFVIKKRNTKQNEIFYILLCLGNNALGYVPAYLIKDYSRRNFEDWTKIDTIQNFAYADSNLQGTI